jgi:hypothetical protein
MQSDHLVVLDRGRSDTMSSMEADLLPVLDEAFPCDGCPMSWRCAQGMACRAFAAYTTSKGVEARWRSLPRVPDRDLYIRMYGKQTRMRRPAKAPRVDTAGAIAERKRQASATRLLSAGLIQPPISPQRPTPRRIDPSIRARASAQRRDPWRLLMAGGPLLMGTDRRRLAQGTSVTRT